MIHPSASSGSLGLYIPPLGSWAGNRVICAVRAKQPQENRQRSLPKETKKDSGGPVIYPPTTQRTRLQNLTTLHQRLPTRAKSKALASGVYLPKASQGPRTKQGTPPKLKARRRVNRRDSQHSSLSFNIQLPLPAHLFSVSKQAVRFHSNQKAQVHCDSRRDLVMRPNLKVQGDSRSTYNYASQQYHKSKLISESYICRSSPRVLYDDTRTTGTGVGIFFRVENNSNPTRCPATIAQRALPSKQSFITTATLTATPTISHSNDPTHPVRPLTLGNTPCSIHSITALAAEP
ncbi:uncharacterized protein LACBIDRAFT_330417 [Laccaria bicolor S238N-H82]|uniref:Predicted protein n=1 Tax=Laccaria bicolor (strain S238N-H82 / ATCC MYA-4686) TaxID=486041 RepID=B0DL85_LACBS|nr:uncharacterized protein LACBIDRAFT_330417 [Laccaria bicolor S238N-H82]EDR04608.1 predicted protein [Laccaria bicolor S238N-H82]|eukprot:XP_001884780.1 predicted protein [Laccaria bicolor S238N-H82]